MYKRMIVVALAATLLSGCAATQVAISKRDLDVQTKMSDTVFLDPVGADKKTIFVQIRYTSDKPDLSVNDEIAAALQANILQVGKAAPSAIEAAMQQGYGVSAVGGLVLGSGVAYATGSGGRGIAAAGLIGAIAETVAGAAVKDVYFSMITDLQLKERMRGKGKASVSSRHNLRQGNSGSTQVAYDEESEYKSYQTRIGSTANKVNLEFEEALPELKKGLITSISGLF